MALGRTYVESTKCEKETGRPSERGPRGTLCKKSMATGENVGDTCVPPQGGSEHNTKVTVGWDEFQQVAAERETAHDGLERAGPNTMTADFSGPIRKENLH